MLQTFYLSSHDYVTTPEPRECRYLGDCVVRQTGQRLFRVAIAPPLPASIARMPSEITTLLLGPVDPEANVSDVGTHHFIVDIYLTRGRVNDCECNIEELDRIGCGLLHSNILEAIKASPLDN